MKPNKQDVAERIKKIREDSGLSIANMAERLGISKSTLNSYIRALALPPEEIVDKISITTNVPKEWIYYGSLKEYIYNYLIFKGYATFLKDYPEVVDEVYKKIIQVDKSEIPKSVYPHPVTIDNAFYDIYESIFKEYVLKLISRFIEDIKKYPLYNGTPKHNKDKYVSRVLGLIRQEKPKIKYGDDNRIIKIAEEEFNVRVDSYMQRKEKIVYEGEDELMKFLLKKLATDEGTIEVLSSIIHYNDLKQEKISYDIIDVFRENYAKLKKISKENDL